MAMLFRPFAAVAILASVLGVTSASADEIRYYEQNGITYRETRQIVQRPVCETHLQPTSRTIYREQISSECRDVVRTVWVPVTQYCCQSYVEVRCTYGEPYYATYAVPQVCWEQRIETIRTPVVCRRWVPECQTTLVPATTQRMACQEVVTRVALNTNGQPVMGSACAPCPCAVPVLAPAMGQNPISTMNEPMGGLARLQQDPPRYGTSAAPPTLAR
jgi:hypothetical protein